MYNARDVPLVKTQKNDVSKNLKFVCEKIEKNLAKINFKKESQLLRYLFKQKTDVMNIGFHWGVYVKNRKYFFLFDTLTTF